MKRSDEKNLNRVGKFLLDNYSWVTSTAMTQNEDYVTDITITTDSATTHNLEVKTIRGGKRLFKSPSIFVDDDRVWDMQDVWMLNKSCDGGISKWDKITSGVYDGIIFYREKEKEVILFNRKSLMDAYICDGTLRVQHTTDFENNKMQWEEKVFIDLSKGKRYRI